MFEGYTERARRVISWSKYMASERGCPEIEVEHLLLGLLREDMGLAERFLGSPWAVESIWRRVDQSKPVGKRPLGPGDLPLNNEGKCVLALGAEEADRVSEKKIGTGHLLLGLLREKKCLAAKILDERGVRLESSRQELARMPHDDAIRKEFVREQASLPEGVVELQAQIRRIAKSGEDAFINRDFERARALSDKEREEREKLYSLCEQHGLLEWLFT
jgi:ATP-dependent Clp protease ATP-binding subunit ClpC